MTALAASLQAMRKALAFQDSREPKYRAPEFETASMLMPVGWPTYADLRALLAAVEIGEALAAVPADQFWLMGKGRLRPSEPPYAFQLIEPGTEYVISAAEGDNLAGCIRDTLIAAQEACPGHVASSNDPKICGRCGTHVDEMRPPEDEFVTA